MDQPSICQDVIEVINRVRRLTSDEGYFARFYEIYSTGCNQVQAWEQVESEREEIGLPFKYVSYKSFTCAMYKRIKQHRHSEV